MNDREAEVTQGTKAVMKDIDAKVLKDTQAALMKDAEAEVMEVMKDTEDVDNSCKLNKETQAKVNSREDTVKMAKNLLWPAGRTK